LALNLAFKADILNQTLHTVLLPAASSLSARWQFYTYLRRNLARSAALIMILVVAWGAAPLFIRLVYGGDFTASSEVFRWLLLVSALDLVWTPIALLAFPLNMPRAILTSNVIRVGVLLFLGSQLIPQWGLLGAVAAKLAAKTAGALFMGSLIAHRLRRPEWPPAEAAADTTPDSLAGPQEPAAFG
jgi:O-antigen/teichoic acid export membrane protein